MNDTLNDALYYLTNTLPNCEKPIILKDGRHVPCGYCPLCIEKKRKDWIMRNKLELSQHKEAMFLTLTFAPDKLKNTSYLQVQYFLKRLRKYIQTFISKTKYIKYFGCYENGEKSGRPHYHLIVYGAYIQPRYNKRGICVETTNEILGRIWGNGIVYCEPVKDEAAINYVTKYMLKQEEPQPELFTDRRCYNKDNKYNPNKIQRNSFLFMSKGLGYNYLKTRQETLLDKNYITHKGFKFAIPRSFMEKLKREELYTRDENNEILINKEFEKYLEKYPCEQITLQYLENYIEYHYKNTKAEAQGKRSVIYEKT